MRRMPVVVAACLVSVAVALPARAASFDCNKAMAPDEIAICTNPMLSALDSEMGGLWYAYSQVPFLMGMSGARQDEARAFLQNRALCGANVVCLTQAYHARIQVLKNDIKAGMQSQCQAG
jgi:uncharacterized protein